MRVLIFGGTPLATRLAYYIKAYSEVKNIVATVIQRELDSTATLHTIQQHVWNTYVSDTEGRADLIINAHETNVLTLCETDPTLAWRTNTRHAAWIAYAARTANVPLVLFSSDHVFRGANGPYEPGRNTEGETPVNVYGVTKWYAEQIAQRLYSKRVVEGNEWINPGTTIVRTSDLYGVDVPLSVPAQLAHWIPHEDDPQCQVHGVVRNPAKVSPSFIGEVAFLVARNLLLSHQSFNEPIVHIAPDDPTKDWASYLHDLGCDVMYQEVGESKRRTPDERLHRQGKRRGLTPTAGWFLPSGNARKSFDDFLSEYRLEGHWQYVRYWDAN